MVHVEAHPWYGLFSTRLFAVLYFNMARFVFGSFPVRFFHRHLFSITSPLRFSVRFWLPCSLSLCFQQLLRFVFQKSIPFFVSENPLRKLTSGAQASILMLPVLSLAMTVPPVTSGSEQDYYSSRQKSSEFARLPLQTERFLY